MTMNGRPKFLIAFDVYSRIAMGAVIAAPQLSLSTQDRDRTIADSTQKSGESAYGAAKSAAIDPELADLVANWPSLPAIIKAAIIAVARQHPIKE